MPDYTAFSARFLEYSQILTKLTGKRNNDEDYLAFLGTLTALSNKLNVLSTEGYALRAEDINELTRLYMQAQNATQTYLDQESPSSLDRQRMYVAKQFTGLLDRDINALSKAAGLTGVTMQDLFRHGRAAHLDISGSGQTKAGNAFSNRLPVCYQSADGTVHRGFFTREITVRERNNDIVRDQLRSFKDAYPAYANVWDAIADQEDARLSYLARQVAGFTEEPADPFLGGEKDPYREILPGALYQQLQQDENFRQIAADFDRRLTSAVKSASTLINNINAQAGSSITDRNCAMTAAATLLNRPDLLARSEKAVIYQNGARVEGCMMHNAVGTDLDNLRPNDMAVEWRKQADERSGGPLVDGDCLRQLADLQILDFLCGNVDRHARNMFYQYRRDNNGNVALVGVMGIDNDYSFGTVGLENSIHHNAGLKNLGFISRSMADRISAVTPEMLEITLADMHLTQGEKQAAAERLSQLQQQIAKEQANTVKVDQNTKMQTGRLQIIDDAAFAKLNIRQLQYHSEDSHNIFAVVGVGAANLIQDYVSGSISYAPNKVLYTGAVEGVAPPVESAAVAERLSRIAETMDRYAREANWNSAEFKAMHNALKQLRGSTDQLALQELCGEVEKNTADYIGMKKGVPTTQRGKDRLDLARELREVMGDIRKDIIDSRMAGSDVKPQTFREKYGAQISSGLEQSKSALRQAVAGGQWDKAARETSLLAYYSLAARALDGPGNGSVLDMLNPRNMEKSIASLNKFSNEMIKQMGHEKFSQMAQQEDCDKTIYNWNITRVQTGNARFSKSTKSIDPKQQQTVTQEKQIPSLQGSQ